MLDREIKVGIIDLGINNIQSISNAYKTIGCKVQIIKKKQNFSNLNLIILPGVGSYKKGMQKLKLLNIEKDLKNFLSRGPKNIVVGICLGMQLLFDQSFEFGRTKGMKLIKGDVLPFNLKKCKIIPHMNWSKLIKIKKDKIFNEFDKKSFYFVHSFYCIPFDKETIIAKTYHGNFDFASIVKKKNLIGLQFHPEKSGEDGLKVLKQINKLL